jgi:hypothetical protein
MSHSVALARPAGVRSARAGALFYALALLVWLDVETELLYSVSP